MSTFIPCRKCAKLRGPAPGYYYQDKFVKECDCHKKWWASEQLIANLKASQIWADLTYSPDNYAGSKSVTDVRALRQYTEKFSSKYSQTMLYMYGPNGTQKTTLAMWVARELIKSGKSVYYILMDSLINTLLPDFKTTDSVRDDLIERLLTIDLLIVDEAWDRRTSQIYKSGYQLPYLASFLKNRFETNKKGILFVSNIQPTFIATQGFGDNLQNFIMRNTRESTLTFLDEYAAEVHAINPRGIFDVE